MPFGLINAPPIFMDFYIRVSFALVLYPGDLQSSLLRIRMDLFVCVSIIVSLTKPLSRISIRFLVLTICLINFVLPRVFLRLV